MVPAFLRYNTVALLSLPQPAVRLLCQKKRRPVICFRRYSNSTAAGDSCFQSKYSN